MIKDKPFGNPMTQRETFESFYARKLEALKIQLKEIIKGDLPYVTSETYACKVCASRVKLHAQGRMYCLCCDMPTTWTKDFKARVVEVMRGYPDVDECVEEWRALQNAPSPHEVSFARIAKQGDPELGKRIREAREKHGWTRLELAMQIKQQNGRYLSEKAIQGYETAHGKPSEYVLKKLEKLLGLEVTPDE
jgi:hypothetical protein